MLSKSSWWSVAIENVLLMVCWTALAIHFEHWWIALFAVLCFTSMKEVRKVKEDEN